MILHHIDTHDSVIYYKIQLVFLILNRYLSNESFMSPFYQTGMLSSCVSHSHLHCRDASAYDREVRFLLFWLIISVIVIFRKLITRQACVIE